MRKWWRYLSTFLRHWYTFLLLLAIDPFDILGVFHVIYSPPRWLTQVLLGFAIVLALLLTIIDLKKQAKHNPIAWAVYDKLSELFRELTNADNDKQRDEIHARIEKERGKLPDKGLDKLIRLFLDAEDERARFGLDSYKSDAQYILSLQNESVPVAI